MPSRFWHIIIAVGWLVAGQSLAYSQQPQELPDEGLSVEQAETGRAPGRDGERPPFPVVVVETDEQAAHTPAAANKKPMSMRQPISKLSAMLPRVRSGLLHPLKGKKYGPSISPS